MTDFFRTKENEFYIELKEERYYIPGEDISGDVILDLKKATKTNNIKVTLEGIVEIAGRTLSLFTRSIIIAESLDGQKSYYLEPHTHRFPFRIAIPNSKNHKVPSTLLIPKVLKVSYTLTAIYNKTYTVLEKLCPTTLVNVKILEDINVEKEGLLKEKTMEKELKLTNKKSGQVCVNIAKRAAVKGDVVPVSVKIVYNGRLNKEMGISVQLLRYVYYGRHKSELFGPKVMHEIGSPICMSEVSAKTFDMKLPIPSQICPTVDKSGQSFKIKYGIRIKVNLNESKCESPGNIATFDMPFIIGTYPKLSFNIDDDDEEEHNEEIDANEYDQIAEKIKNVDLLESDIAITSPDTDHRVQPQATVTRIDPTISLDSRKDKPLPLEPIQTKPDYNQPAEILSPPIDRLYPQQLSPSYNNYQPISSPVYIQSSGSVHRASTCSSNSSGQESIYNHSSRSNSINYPSSPNSVRQASVQFHDGFLVDRQGSMHYPGPVRHESFHQSIGRQESVRWVAPSSANNNNPPYPMNQDPSISMPTPYLSSQPPFMIHHHSFYPPDNMGGFPIPQHDPPPPNPGFIINMPSAANYKP